MILITGASGFLGTKALSISDAIGLSRTGRDGMINVDYTDRGAIKKILGDLHVKENDTVIHMGAQSSAYKCRTEPDLAYKANTLSTQVIAEVCAERNLRMIYMSTAYVFEGDKKGSYLETNTDYLHPKTVYGKSKLKGEEAMTTALPKGRRCIVRAPGLYGFNGVNKPNGIVGEILFSEGKPLSPINHEQLANPLFADDVVDGLKRIIEKDFWEDIPVLHFGGPDVMTRYELAQAISKLLPAEKRPVLKPISNKEEDPHRPYNVVLDTSIAQEKLGIRFQSVEEALVLIGEEI